jgi:hypothetical protein
MNPLVRKEIRLVLPAWLAVLALAVWHPWFFHEVNDGIGFAPFFIFFGMILLAVDSFGREFSLGTFSGMMSQPVDRRQIWRAKIGVLLTAAGFAFAASLASWQLRLHLGFDHRQFMWLAGEDNAESNLNTAMFPAAVGALVALTGGLWAALLLRQISMAFWIAVLVPAGILSLVVLGMSQWFENASHPAFNKVIYVVAGLYVIGAFWLAHRLFFSAQDAGWGGTVISLAKWRYFERAGQPAVSRRHRRPFGALLKKEFQLQGVTMFGAVVLLGLHVILFYVRVHYVPTHSNTLASLFSDCFWSFWMIIPVVMGCTAVAEERKLGVADSQSVLPVSRPRQFALKLGFTMVFGVLLGGLVPLLLENTASQFGIPSKSFQEQHWVFSEPGVDGPGWLGFQIAVLAAAAGLSWICFFASTAARNFLQALSLAIVIIIGCCFIGAFIQYVFDEKLSLFGLMPVPWLLLILLGGPTLAGTFVWLGYRNFVAYQEGARLWWRNIAGMAGAVLAVLAVSALIYSRVWEVFVADDLPHGVAQLSLASRPVMSGEHRFGGGLQVSLPDGRVWCDSLGYPFWGNGATGWKMFSEFLVHPIPRSIGPQAWIADSNWVSTIVFVPSPREVAATSDPASLKIAGVKADGTLWISSEASPTGWAGARMVRFGSETNWRQVGRLGGLLILLKTDGTLWQWGPSQSGNTIWQARWQSARTDTIWQIGTNSGWQEIIAAEPDFSAAWARKKDGGVWDLTANGKTGDIVLERRSDLDALGSRAFSGAVYAGRDGTLWMAGSRGSSGTAHGIAATGWLQVGQETNWVAAAMANNQVVALKTDGTLWQWDMASGTITGGRNINPNTRLGSHNDWVALTGTWCGVVSLAADGSLWLWPALPPDAPTLLKMPKQPQLISNIFAVK